MAIHDQLPIHKTGSQLLGVAARIHAQMRRGYKRPVGEKIVNHCSDMLDLMALANAAVRDRRQRVEHLQAILTHNRAATTWLRVAFDLREVSPTLWGEATQLLQNVAKQASGWLLAYATQNGYSTTYRAEVRATHGDCTRRKAVPLAVPLRLRHLERGEGRESHLGTHGELWLLPCGAAQQPHTRRDRHADAQALACDARPLPEPECRGLRELRRARRDDLRALERLRALRRRHGRVPGSGVHHRAQEHEWQLRALELPLGDEDGAGAQYPRQSHAHAQRPDPLRQRVGRADRHQAASHPQQAALRMECRAHAYRNDRRPGQQAATQLARFEDFLPRVLGGRLNDSKTILQPVDRGIDFVGQVIKPWRRTTRRRTLHSAINRLQHMPADELFESGNSTLGLVRQASHGYREQVEVCRVLLARGHTVAGNWEKVLRRTQ